MQTSDALGAAAAQLGPDAQAAVVGLNKQAGLSHGKLSHCLASLRKVWGGSCTWVGARAQSVLMSVWRTCWPHERPALDFLLQLLRGRPVALAMPP